MKASIRTMEKVVSARKTSNPADLFRDGSNYRAIVVMGSSRPIRRETLVRKAVKTLHLAARKAEWDIDVLANPNHTSNGGRVKNDPALEKRKMIHFVTA